MAEQYESFKMKQQQLSRMLEETSLIVSQLKMDKVADNLKILSEKVHNDTFKILIVGTFKNGKSTFINSFLGEPVLPAYTIPCTAVINEIKYSEEKKAVLFFRKDLPEQLPANIPPETLEYMKKYNMQDIPPMEIPYNDIIKYIVIPMGEDAKESIKESPYEKVELYWPLPILKNGVEIIDSPGLNEHATRTKVTMDYLTNADAILFVLIADKLCSADEMDFIEYNLNAQGYTDPFFIVNHFDYIAPEEKDLVKQFALQKLEHFTDFGEEGIFYLSAKDALDGKRENNAEKLETSGLPLFENVLSSYLTKNRGKAKLSHPAKELKRILNEELLYKVIPMQKEILSSSLNDLKAKYEETAPKINELKTQKENVRQKLSISARKALEEVERVTRQNYTDLMNYIPVWVKDYSPQTNVGLTVSEKKLKMVVDEITDYVSKNTEQQQIDWQNRVLGPLLEEKIKSIFSSVEDEIAEIFEEIAKIDVSFTNTDSVALANLENHSALDKMMGSAVTFLNKKGIVGNFSRVASCITKSLCFSAASIVLLAIFCPAATGVTVLATIVTSFLGAGAVDFAMGGKAMINKIKDNVTTALIKQISEQQNETVKKINDVVLAKMNEFIDASIASIDVEIDTTKNVIEQCIQDVAQGQEAINEQLANLENSEQIIKGLNMELDSLIFNLVET